MPNFQPIERCADFIRTDISTIVATITYSGSATYSDSCDYEVATSMSCVATWTRDNTQTAENSFKLVSACCNGSKGRVPATGYFIGNGPTPEDGIFIGGSASGSRTGNGSGGCTDESASGDCQFLLQLSVNPATPDPQNIFVSVSPNVSMPSLVAFPGATGSIDADFFMPGDVFEVDLSGNYDADGTPNPSGAYAVSSIITVEAFA